MCADLQRDFVAPFHRMENVSPTMPHPWLYAVIGVWTTRNKTFYVHRSQQMENYPNVWSLLSIQFHPEELRDHTDLDSAQRIMERMSTERLNGAGIRVERFLTSAMCGNNPIQKRVLLNMYEIRLEREPTLNSRYYSGHEWMTPEDYVERSKDAACGLCMRMWSDYCVRNGLTDRAFAPALHSHPRQNLKSPRGSVHPVKNV
jgi:hypothetical protein